MSYRIPLTALCCLVPLVALATTMFFYAPVLLTVIAGLAVLVPLAYRLLSADLRRSTRSSRRHKNRSGV